MKVIQNKIVWTIVFYLWILALIFFTSTPSSYQIANEEGGGPRWDYLEHFFLFLLIPVFYFFAEGAFLSNLIKKSYQTFLLGLVFVSLTEFQQLYIESRTFNPVDLALNISGYLIGIPLGMILLRQFKKG